MTKEAGQIAETVDTHECDGYDGYEYELKKKNGGRIDNNDETEGTDDEEHKVFFQLQYDKYRDDQMNTGVIAALLGGFALTNSWEMGIGDHERPEDCKTIDLAAYTLAILAVHACTCSALTSAFLYRSLTQQTTPRKGIAWMNRHYGLAQVPWYKFIGGVLCYVVSVCLVAWSSLEISAITRGITLFAGICGCGIVFYTIYVIQTDEDPDPDPRLSPSALGRTHSKKVPNSRRKNHTRRHKRGLLL
eukprot:CAMPEP_0201128596 /NCGR_PEP_ID=MMETSP0850-20130426/34220_1 /ASSEMBLY_ACC=CAM_ASM_000622 /TAXON_ID=183588 /ORGANISM="Pseudo-nitzschia fraudulenta, Strain WWA7" /LENGTH=245 /DNA_ID=CAMNT_0047397825 /DNA_START=87 /DNA_END=824 /DNA_ORIENTATION=-